MISDIPDYETAVSTLAYVMIEHLFQVDAATTAGAELMSLPKADALLVVLNMAEAGISSEAYQMLERQILEHVGQRRHRKLRKVLKEGYGLSDVSF